MNNIEVNFNNLTESERKQLLSLVEKSNKGVRLSEIEVGETFKIGDVEFIKIADFGGTVTAVTRDCVFTSDFGSNNNLAESKVLKRLEAEFLPKIAEAVGIENICNTTTDLTTLDGLKPYEKLTSKVTLPEFDFYRRNVKVFDKYKIDKWWWLATPESANPHSDPNWIVCVSPSGDICGVNYINYRGVRPFLRFVSSIFVSKGN